MDTAFVAAVAPVLSALVGGVCMLAGIRMGRTRERRDAHPPPTLADATGPHSVAVDSARASLTSELARLEVLVVEDNAAQREGAAKLLRSHDVTVAAVGSVGEARAILGSLPRVLVVDLHLGGMSGEDVLSALPLVVLWTGREAAEAQAIVDALPVPVVVTKGDVGGFEREVLARLGRVVE